MFVSTFCRTRAQRPVFSSATPSRATIIVTTDAVLVREIVGAKTSPLRHVVLGLADE